MPQIHIRQPNGSIRTANFTPGKTLRAILQAEGIFIPAPCGGAGFCGKCTIGISSRYQASPEDFVQSCTFTPAGDVMVFLPEEELTEILETAPPQYGRASRFTRTRLFLPPADGVTVLEDILGLGKRLPLFLLRSLPLHPGNYSAVFRDGEAVCLYPGDDPPIGVALDIGTTTVSLSGFDLESGASIGTASFRNPQCTLGLDVLARIDAARDEEGLTTLHRMIADAVAQAIQDLFNRTGHSTRSLAEISVAANPTMAHLLLGVSPRGIGHFPYRLTVGSEVQLPCASLFRNDAFGGVIRAYPSAGAYIGSDAIFGALSALSSGGEDLLMVDIGTNGELISCCRGTVQATSAAMGPALEGMNITCGMRASPGAIDSAPIRDGRFCCTVIGDVPARGICGSGLISAVASALDAGVITRGGRLISPDEATEEQRPLLCLHEGKPALALADGVVLTRRDIRQVQLAKAALRSACDALLEGDDLRFAVAGQFGYHLDAYALIRTGFFPPAAQGRISFLGNSALRGAERMLFDEDFAARYRELVGQIDTLDLTRLDTYQEMFLAAGYFPTKEEIHG